MLNTKKFTSEMIKQIFQAIKDKKEINVRGRMVKILEIKEANAGYDYAKVRIKLDPGKSQYLELYWEDCPYFGVDLSEDINEFTDYEFGKSQLPKILERKGKEYRLFDMGTSKVTESDGTGDYKKGDKVYFWEYFDDQKQSRVSLGYNIRSKKWLNMFAEKLTPSEIKWV
jgi:hypothetical protein